MFFGVILSIWTALNVLKPWYPTYLRFMGIFAWLCGSFLIVALFLTQEDAVTRETLHNPSVYAKKCCKPIAAPESTRCRSA